MYDVTSGKGGKCQHTDKTKQKTAEKNILMYSGL